MKPMLNLGCGRIILPGPRPAHHSLIPEEIYAYPEWVNIDKNMQPGVDRVMDLFTYPWGLEDNAYSGALLTHVAEHIPHEIRINKEVLHHTEAGTLTQESHNKKCELREMQDGWFAFFSELWRVLEHGAVVHLVSPYGHGDDAISDPSHTRYLTEYSVRHSMQPNPDAPFEYKHKLHFNVLEQTAMLPMPDFNSPPYFVDGQPTEAFWRAKRTQINVVREFYSQLVVVKEY